MIQEYRLPSINAPTVQGQIQQLQSYLKQLVGQMNFQLSSREEGEEAPQTATETFSAIRCYPVGSLYLTTSSVDPQSLFGGRWEQLKDRFLLAAGDTYLPGATGGEARVRLTAGQMPVHSHRLSCREIVVDQGTELSVTVLEGDDSAVTTAAGGGGEHNNLPPYLAVYVWKRIA